MGSRELQKKVSVTQIRTSAFGYSTDTQEFKAAAKNHSKTQEGVPDFCTTPRQELKNVIAVKGDYYLTNI